MLSLQTFVIENIEDKDDVMDALKDGKSLDPYDFSIHGYAVDETKYPVMGKAVLKGKARAREEEDQEYEEEESAEAADTPSSSDFDFSHEESDAEVTPRASRSGRDADSTSVDPDLDFPNLYINEERPRSSPEFRNIATRGGGLTKKRRVGTSERSSPMSRFKAEDERIELLNKRMEEEREERRKMQESFHEREAFLRAEQERRDEESRKRHEDLMELFKMVIGGTRGASLPAPIVQPVAPSPASASDVVPHPIAVEEPAIQSGHAGVGQDGDNASQDIPSPPSPTTVISEPSPISPAPEVPHTQSEGDVGDTSSGPSSS